MGDREINFKIIYNSSFIFKFGCFFYIIFLTTYYFEYVITLEKYECLVCNIQTYATSIISPDEHLGILDISSGTIDKINLYKYAQQNNLPLVQIIASNDITYQCPLYKDFAFEFEIFSRSPIRLDIKKLQLSYCFSHANLLQETCDGIGFLIIDLERNTLYFIPKENRETIYTFGYFKISIIREGYLSKFFIELINK